MIPQEIKWDGEGLIPVVIQDANTGDVLTLAYANSEALEKTIASKTTHLYSRSRNSLWSKGEQSGHTQEVVSVSYDCDADALLYRVIPHGPGCHTGAQSCFHKDMFGEHDTGEGAFQAALAHLLNVLKERKRVSPEHSYVAKLYASGVDRIAKKIGEEATEVVIAAKNDNRKELVWEVADLFFHLLVLLEHKNISLDEVGTELMSRAKK